jgi:hypothetical protein
MGVKGELEVELRLEGKISKGETITLSSGILISSIKGFLEGGDRLEGETFKLFRDLLFVGFFFGGDFWRVGDGDEDKTASL